MKARRSPQRARCVGNGLLAVLLLSAVLGAAAMLGQGEAAANARQRAQARSVAALAQAREALLGYAISYRETHSEQDYGYLPCPDSGNSGSTPPGACGARDLASFGRFPWRTLALGELRDGADECLWYGVAGSIKNNPKALHFNWDSPSQFELIDAKGSALPIAAADGRAVAVVIAPGVALGAQHRSGAVSGPCRGGASASADLAAFVDSAPGSLAHSIVLRQGLSGSEEYNDLLAWIGIDEIFDALRRRSDYAAYIDAIGERAAAALAARIHAADTAAEDFITTHTAPVSPSLRTGALPSANELGLVDPLGDYSRAHDNWRTQFVIALCTADDACIEIEREDGSRGGTEHCRAALLFGGERIRRDAARQQRTGAGAHAEPAQYFEGDNAQHLQLGIPHFHGAAQFRVYDASQPASADVVRCLP